MGGIFYLIYMVIHLNGLYVSLWHNIKINNRGLSEEVRSL